MIYQYYSRNDKMALERHKEHCKRFSCNAPEMNDERNQKDMIRSQGVHNAA